MNKEIKFPIMDLTEILFEREGVFFSDLTWETKYTLKEKDVKKIPSWKYVDSGGNQLKVKIIKKEKIKNFLSFLTQSMYKIELQLIHVDKVYQLEELKVEILKKQNKMFHIYHNKALTLDEYKKKLNNADSFLSIIDVASFEDYKEK